MGKISYYDDRGGGRTDSRDSDRRRGYQSGHFDRRNGHSGDSRGRSNLSNNNRGSEDLRSRLGKKSSAVEKDKGSSVRKKEKPAVKTTPVKLNHIEEEEKKEEDLELRQMKVRKLNPNAFALSSIVRKQASDNTKVKQLSTKSKRSKAPEEDSDVRIVNSNFKDEGKKFGKTVKSHDGAIRIANDDREVEKRPVERKIKYRHDSLARKAVERSRSPSSSSSAESSSDSSHSDQKKSQRKKKKYNRKVEERKRKKTSGKVSAKSLMKQLVGADLGSLLKNLSSDQIKLIKEDPSFTKGDLQALQDIGLISPEKSSSESSSSSSSSSSSDSSDSDDDKAEDTFSIQSCEPVTICDFKKADASRESRGDELSIEEELALNKARQKALDSPKKIIGKPKGKNRSVEDVPTCHGEKRGDSRSVSVQDKKQHGDRSTLLNDEESKKQRLFNRLQKSKSTSDIKARLGNKIDQGQDSPNNVSVSLDKDPRPKSGEKRSSPADDHSSDRFKRRRSDHVGSRDRSSERKRESYDRRTRSPYDKRTRSPYGRRTKSPYNKRSRSPYLWENSFDKRERSPRRHQRSRSRDNKRGISPSSKITSGIA